MAKLIGTRTKVIVDPKAAAKLGVDREMGAYLAVVADEAAEVVRELAPKGESPADEGYAEQVEGQVQLLGKRFFIGRVSAHKFTAHWLEFGTINMLARAPLRRGVEAYGLRVRSGRRDTH